MSSFLVSLRSGLKVIFLRARFKVQGRGLGVQGLGLGVWCLGCRVSVQLPRQFQGLLACCRERVRCQFYTGFSGRLSGLNPQSPRLQPIEPVKDPLQEPPNGRSPGRRTRAGPDVEGNVVPRVGSGFLGGVGFTR